MIGAHTVLPNKIVFVIGTKTYSIAKNDPRWDEVNALAIKRDYVAVQRMLSESRQAYIMKTVNSALKEENVDNFKFEEFDDCVDGSVEWDGRYVKVYYKGMLLPNVLQRRMFQCLEREGRDVVKAWPKFVENILANPDEHCRNAVYEFLENRELPLVLEDGTFIAYKGVRDDFWSEHGNKRTRVISGQVDSEGRILNSVGSVIEVVRADVDTDCDNHCSWGLHVGAKAYATSFAPKTLLVKVNPKDVVTVPTDTAEKCRVSRYEVIGVWGGDDIPGTVVSVNGTKVHECAAALSDSCKYGEFIASHFDEVRAVVDGMIDDQYSAVQVAPVTPSEVDSYLPEGWSAGIIDSVCEVCFNGDDGTSNFTCPQVVDLGGTYEHPDKEEWFVPAIDDYHEDCPEDVEADELWSYFPDEIVPNAALLGDLSDAVDEMLLSKYSCAFGNLAEHAKYSELLGKLLAAGYTVRDASCCDCGLGKLVISH